MWLFDVLEHKSAVADVLAKRYTPNHLPSELLSNLRAIAAIIEERKKKSSLDRACLWTGLETRLGSPVIAVEPKQPVAAVACQVPTFLDQSLGNS